ncbi:MAG: zinc-ribbon domain-containing protein [Prevotella sp.]|nr:zinc-ribbon domain-containing protein [Prevotella sp.]
MKKCSNCGAMVKDDALWCPECGADVGNEASQPAPVVNVEPEVVVQQQEQPRRHRRPLIIPKKEENVLGIVSFVLTMVGLVGVVSLSWVGVGLVFLFLFPISMILGFFAMFKKPRGFAVAAFIISLLANLVSLVILLFFSFLFGAIFAS